MLKVAPFFAKTREMLKITLPKPYECPQTQDMLKVAPFLVKNPGNVKGGAPQFMNMSQNAGNVKDVKMLKVSRNYCLHKAIVARNL